MLDLDQNRLSIHLVNRNTVFSFFLLANDAMLSFLGDIRKIFDTTTQALSLFLKGPVLSVL